MYSTRYKTALTLPPLLWVGIMLLVPYALLLAYSFWSVTPAQTILHTFTFSNYIHLLTTHVYVTVLLRSLRIAATVAICCLLLGYPTAYCIIHYGGRYKGILYQAVIIPLWVSYLVRAYAWKTILGNTGILNSFLLRIHAIHQPLGFLLYSQFAVALTLTHIYLPFVILPIAASLEQIPHRLIEASRDLGAGPTYTFLHIILPLSMPGVISGATFAFLISFGDFLSPLLVGGPSGVMIANIVANLFGADYNWPLGASLGVLILITVLALLSLTDIAERRWRTQ